MAFKEGIIIGPSVLNGGTVDIGTDNATNAITIGAGTSNRIIQIGFSSANHTITVGVNNGTTTLNLLGGSGGIDVNSVGGSVEIDGSAGIFINSSASTINIGDDAAAFGINIGTGAAARTITIGNNTGATGLQLTSGTGSIALLSTGTGDITIDSDDTLLLDSDGVLELNSSAGAISIGNDAVSQAINIGTGGAARTITIGNTTGATDLDLRCGTGDFTLASATGTIINALDTGEITYPLQSAFSAYQATTASNVTGNGTYYVVGTTVAFTEIFDQNSDFNTNGTFTAPVTGRYFLANGIRMQEIGAGSSIDYLLDTSNRDWRGPIFNPSTAAISGAQGTSFSAFVDMDAGDSAVIQIRILGTGADTADIGGSSDPITWFCGYLAC